MVKPSSPSKAITAAMASLHGRRTGIALAKKGQVAINKDDQMEDVDELWKSAQTPKQQQQQPDADDEEEEDDDEKQTSQKPRAVKAQKPRFSLRGQAKDKDDDDNTEEKANDKASHILSRVGSEWNNHDSPSELSRVSTAPPTPASQPEEEEQPQQDKNTEDAAADDDEGRPLPSLPQEEEEQDDDVPPPFSPPEEGVGGTLQKEDQEEEEVVAHASGSNQSPLLDTQETNEQKEEQEVEVDDDDDMVPPPPPPEEDDDDDEDQQEVAPTTQDDTVDFPLHDDDDDSHDDDDDKEGEGFAIVHDPETPDSVRAQRVAQEQEAHAQERRKRGRPRKAKETSSTTSSSIAASEQSSKVSKTKKGRGRPKRTSNNKTRKKKVEFKESPMGYPAGNRDYEVIPVSDYKASPPDEGVRRSRRARVPPLAFWKNERPLYEAHNETGILGEAMGHMPVVSGYISANPTPYKKRKAPAAAANKKNKKQKSSYSSLEGTEDEEDVPFDSRKLRKKYNIIDGEEANMWDEIEDDITEQKVVSYADTMVATDLPLPSTRKKSEGKIVGKAAQAFNVPTDEDDLYVGYIMGNLRLPPGGIKDPESSGACSLSFTVCLGQPKSIELAYGDPNEQDGELNLKTAQRFLLSPGDMFRVMPGNSYRLQNHSKTKDCSLSWTIIRPRRNPPPDDA